MQKTVPQKQRNGSNLFMLQKRITYSQPMQLKIMTQVKQNIPTACRPSDSFQIAQITVYTDNNAYQGTLTGKCIAKQLFWNSESLSTLMQCLMGKRDKVQMRFYPILGTQQLRQKVFDQEYINVPTTLTNCFQIICQISSGINLTLFTIQMTSQVSCNPFFHMKQKLSQLQHSFREKQLRHKQKQQKLKAQLNEIQAIEKQIVDSSQIQINVMKSNFVKIINQCKLQIRKLVGTIPTINPISGLVQTKSIKGHIQNIQQEQKESDGEEKYDGNYDKKTNNREKKSRLIKTVNRNSYQKVQNKKMQLQDQQLNIYYQTNCQDTSKKIIEQRIQKRQIHHNKNKFAQDSSDDQQFDPDERIQFENKAQKTFLEMQTQKKQLQKKVQEDGTHWDQLFN